LTFNHISFFLYWVKTIRGLLLGKPLLR